ncbi:MAG: hypothetical protein SF182_17455 [Deltaproteobacteria bacterium]|nr:hypothetical protein [Deltaproteobacteria bacterium]
MALIAVLLPSAHTATADVASDHPAAILVFPKLLVDTGSGLETLIRISNVSESPINVWCFYVNATPRCTVPGGTCFPDKRSCSAVIGGQTLFGECDPQWQETDFLFRLTREQPTGWLVSAGQNVDCRLIDGVCSNDGTTVCDRDSQCGVGNRCVQPACLPLDGGVLGRTGPGGQVNEGRIPPSPDDPMIGELKCIALDDGQKPVARNDLIGQALIGRLRAGPDETTDISGYNAIGIPAIPGTGNRDSTLVLGGSPDVAEYEGCPNILILDHFFDGAVDPILENTCLPDDTCSIDGLACTSTADCLENRCINDVCTVTGNACADAADCANTCENDKCTLSGENCLNDSDCTEPTYEVRVATDLTMVPCTEDFEEQRPELSRTTAQFLVFNEFEQRFSTSIPVECFKEIQLSAITSGDNSRSIFAAGVAGTLTGQTRIRGVENQENAGIAGNTLLGIAEEFRCAGAPFQFPVCDYVQQPERTVSGNAKNLHFQGRRALSDFIYTPELH